MKEEQYNATLEIFEDMHRANMRASVYELEQCLQSMELLKRPRGCNALQVQKTLRYFMEQSITTLEQRLAALRTRFEALPELKAKRRRGRCE
jgi:hypothetical protein